MVRFDGCEWDAAKAADNLAKRRVSFEAACAALDDPRRDDVDDWLHSADERRLAVSCLSPGGRIPFVVFTPRAGALRPISARAAGLAERDRHVRHASRYDAGAADPEGDAGDRTARPPRRRRPRRRR